MAENEKTRFSKKQKTISVVLACTLVVAAVSVAFTAVQNKKAVESALQNTAENTIISKISEELSQSYSDMSQAFAKNDINTVKSIAKSTLGNIDDMKKELAENNNEVNKVLKDINSDELNKRQASYEEEANKQIENAEKCLGSISENNGDIKETLNEYEQIFNEPKKDVIVDNSNANPQNSVKGKYEQLDISKAENISDKVVSMSLDSTNTSGESLELTGDTAITDEIKAKADELKTPFAVYEFVRNNINHEAYYGSRKGATGTYDAKAGNDTDTASLLIAMLRYLGYNSKYANGTVRITAQQAMDWTLADSAKGAAQTLVNMGKSVKTYSRNGEIAFLEINQTWAEVYIPYTDYRGAGNAEGEYRWIPLDASFKQYETRTVELENYNSEDTQYMESVANAKGLLSQLPEFSKISSYYESDYDTKGGVMTIPVIVPYSSEYLPLSLEYDVVSEKTATTATSLVSSDTVTVSVGYDLSYSMRSADVYNKRITVDYSPASSYDEQLIQSYGDIKKVPAHLLTLVPTINIDDVEVAKGDDFLDAVTSGTKQQMVISMTSGGRTQTESDEVYAGSVYSLVLDYGMMTSNEYETAYNDACQNNMHSTTTNIYSSEILGSFLTFIGRTYYSMTDVQNQYSEYMYNVSNTKALGMAIISYELKRNTMFGYVTELSDGSFKIDVEFNTSSTVDLCSSNNNAKMFGMITGFSDSSSEARVWEIILHKKGVSSIDVLSAAMSNNIDILYVTSDNVNEEIEKIDTDSKTKSDITNFINQGYTIIVPEKEVTINSWEGIGFIALDYNTGSATYRLTGGINGGGDAELDDLAKSSYYADLISDDELDDYVFASLYIVQVMHRVFTIINYNSLLEKVTSFTSSAYTGDIKGLFFGGLGLANAIDSINKDINRYYGSLFNIIDYFGYDNENAGREIVANALDYLADFYKGMVENYGIIYNGVENAFKSVVDEAFESVLGWEKASDDIGEVFSFIENYFGASTTVAKEQSALYLMYGYGILNGLVKNGQYPH